MALRNRRESLSIAKSHYLWHPSGIVIQPSLTHFKELLDTQHAWPCHYTFKFIVKKEDATKVTDFFEDGFITFKESSKGKYVSINVSVLMDSSESVILKYEEVAKVPGVISL